MRVLLWPFSILFALIVFVRNSFYNRGVLNSKKLQKPVICVGNLSTGGTGKTPWVKLLTDYFSNHSKKLVILSRGYSGDFDGVLKVDPSMDPRKCGDEPLWLAKNSSATVYVGRNRHLAGLKAFEEEKPDLFLLDDGFQHRKLKRQVDIVLVDASAPRWQYHFLPVGLLREPFTSLSRAQIVILHKCNYANPEDMQWLLQKIESQVGSERIFKSNFEFSHWDPLVEGLHMAEPKGPVSMSCGVGNPEAFLKTLLDQKVEPVKKFIFPDHYFWKPQDIERMTYNMKREGSQDLMITEKDAIKLIRYKKHFKEVGIQVWICKMKVVLLKGEAHFFKILQESLDKTLD